MARIVISLLLLISTLSFIATSGCGSTSFSIKERETVAEIVNAIPETNMNEGLKTATFALG